MGLWRLGLAILLLVLTAAPMLAQTTPQTPPASPPGGQTSSMPGASSTPGASSPSGASSSPGAGQTALNPNLRIVTVRTEGGYRASKLLGMAVRNDQKDKIGTVDDLIINDANNVVMAVISVGGFLGIGTKLVAVPYANLHLDLNDDGGTLLLPGASKEGLTAMPNITFGG